MPPRPCPPTKPSSSTTRVREVLADENLDSLVVRWLRERGHDVIWMVDLAPGAIDSDVLARTADRVLLTQDRDFGRMVFL